MNEEGRGSDAAVMLLLLIVMKLLLNRIAINMRIAMMVTAMTHTRTHDNCDVKVARNLAYGEGENILVYEAGMSW